MNKNEYKDFENQGWEAMFETLDREMPVKKKRRGLLWLWLCLGFLSFGSAFLYYKSTKNTSLTEKMVSKPIVYENRQLGNRGVLEKSSTQIQPDTNISIIENKATFRKSSRFPKSTDAINTENRTTAAQLPITPQTSGEQATNKVVFIQPLKTREDQGFVKETQEENKEIVSQTPILSEEKSRVQVIDSSKLVNTQTTIGIETSDSIKNTPLSTTLDSSLKTASKPIAETIVTPKKMQKKLIWGITAGTHSQKLTSLDGFQAGIIVGKPLNTKWTMATGLSFRQTKMPSQNVATYFASADKSSGSSTVSTTTLLKATSISIDKLYYLEMPITLERKIGKKFAFTTGLKLSYLLSQSVQKSDSSVYWVNGNPFSSSQNLLETVNAATLGLNRWDLAWVGGINYLPSRHINLGLRYDLGLSNILNRANNSVYNRYLGMNLSYFF